MGNYTIFVKFENPRRGRQAINFSENDPKILDLKSSSEQLIFRKLSLGAPADGSGENAQIIEGFSLQNLWPKCQFKGATLWSLRLENFVIWDFSNLFWSLPSYRNHPKSCVSVSFFRVFLFYQADIYIYMAESAKLVLWFRFPNGQAIGKGTFETSCSHP